MNLNQYLETVVSNHPDKIAVKFRGNTFSYKELLDRVCRLANGMKKMGVGKGDVVGVIATNSNSYLEIIYACARIGAITAHYNWRLNPVNILDHLKDSEVKLLYVSQTNDQILKCIIDSDWSNPPCVVIGEGDDESVTLYRDIINDNTGECPIEQMDDEDIIQYMFTSGTTSKPKTVMHTNKSIVTHSLLGSIELDISSEDTLLHVLPMFHATISMVYCTLVVGGTVVILERFDPSSYLESLQDEGVTICALIPVLMDILTRVPDYLKYDLKSLKSIVYAGAPMSMETFKNVRRVLNCGLIQVYGITEMGPSVTMLKPEHHLYFFGLDSRKQLPVGKAILGTAIKIMDDDGNILEKDMVGEIVVKSDTMMKGYKEDGKTVKSIKNGWFHTGDIGYLDQDNFLYLKDRKNHMIISGGENIYPAEIESCIRSMGDSVKDVAVIGVPDKVWGEAVKAIVVRADDRIDENTVIGHCNDNIASYKKPKSVEFWEELPRNQSGKLLKHIIKDMVLNRKSIN